MAGRFNGFIERGHDPPGVVEEDVAFIGQPDPRRMAMEKRHSNDFFQLFDRRGDSRLRDVELHRCAGNLAHIGDRDEIADLTDRWFIHFLDIQFQFLRWSYASIVTREA